MDGVSRVAGSPVSHTIDGKRYLLAPIDFDMLGTLEHELLKTRPNPISGVREALAADDANVFSPEERLAMIQEAVRHVKPSNSASFDEVMEYIQTPAGCALLFWLSVKAHQPDVDYEEARRLLKKVGVNNTAQIVAAIAQGAGIDDLGNSIGQEPPTKAPGSNGSETSQKMKTQAIPAAYLGGD